MTKITTLLITLLMSTLSFAQQYTYTQTSTLTFTDISTTGTELTLGDDDEVNITSLFTIYLGSQGSKNLRIGNNGAILFGVTTGNVSNSNVALSTSTPMIAPFWDDLSDGGAVYYKALSDRLIVQWERKHFNVSTGSTVKFQVVFWAGSDNIYFFYDDTVFGNAAYNHGSSATIGIATSDEVFQFSYNTTNPVPTGAKIKYIPAKTDVPDNNFEFYLETHNASGDVVPIGDENSMGDGNMDDKVITANINNVSSLNVGGYGAADDSERISDLTGIEDFTALTLLECSANLLTALDVSQNVNLVDLRCRRNNLTALNVDTNVNLTALNCSVNQLSEINIDNNTALNWFACYQNFDISTLNLTNNTALTYVNCHFMSLTELNTNQNINLETLRCFGNDITSLNLINNTSLIELFCGGNEFTSLYLNENTALAIFNCSNSDNLTSVKIQNGANGLLSGLVTSGSQTFPRFNTTDCPNLNCIYVDNTTDAIAGINDYLDWSIDANSNFVSNNIECNATYPAPSNNDCANATNLIVGADFDSQAVIATNIGASETVGVEASCGASNQPEIWFTVTVPNSGNVTIETQEVVGSELIDSVIAVYSGVCGSLTAIDCNDDNSEGLFSTIELTNQTPGETLYITAYTYEGDPFGEFKIAAYDSSVSNISNNTISGLLLYPNPVEDTLFIKANNTVETIHIYNMLGQVVLTKSSNFNIVEVDLSTLSSGNYIVKIQSNNQIGTYKLIKK